MTDFQGVSTAALRTLVMETEATLGELRQELERREHIAQHEEIDKLETHMKNTELSLHTIRDFIDYLMNSTKK